MSFFAIFVNIAIKFRIFFGIPGKTFRRQRDERHREEQRLKSRKRVSERMLENREDGLNTKLSEAEPENKAWISNFDLFIRLTQPRTIGWFISGLIIQERGSETHDENGFQSWFWFG